MKFKVITNTSGYGKPEHEVWIVDSEGGILLSASGVQSRETGYPNVRSLAVEIQRKDGTWALY